MWVNLFFTITRVGFSNGERYKQVEKITLCGEIIVSEHNNFGVRKV